MLFSALGIKPIYIFPSVLKGEQYGDEFGKVSIIRKVPVLKDGDFILREVCCYPDLYLKHI